MGHCRRDRAPFGGRKYFVKADYQLVEIDAVGHFITVTEVVNRNLLDHLTRYNPA